MAPAPPPDEKRLEAYYQTETKYVPAPVPTPINRNAAIAFVNARVSRSTPPHRMRKLMRLAVFYNLTETAAAFFAVLTGDESSPGDFVRAAMCLIALAWIGDPAQQNAGRSYFHNLQERADVEEHRAVMLEVVEAFGPSEGTRAHRQWIQTAIAILESRMRQEQVNGNAQGARLLQEKVKTLTEYLNIQLPLVERAFTLRQRIDSMPPDRQIQPLVAYSLGLLSDGSPALSYWASMRLLRVDPSFRTAVGAAFHDAAVTRAGDDMIRARALRAAQFFGYPLPAAAAPPTPPAPSLPKTPLPSSASPAAAGASDSDWLATQPDPGVDPLVLRPRKYLE